MNSDNTAGDAARPGNKPIDYAQVGNVRIPIWRNTSAKGDFVTAGVPELRYKDGDEWKTSTSYCMTDCLCLAEAGREASEKIREHSRSRASRAA
jgi:hypothetical protein